MKISRRKSRLPENSPICPECNSQDLIPLAYGYPTDETFKAADRGEVVLGAASLEAQTWQRTVAEIAAKTFPRCAKTNYLRLRSRKPPYTSAIWRR